MNTNKKNDPSFIVSLLVFLSIVGILISGIFLLKVDIHVLLILGLCITCLISLKYGYSFDELVKGMEKSISRAMTALLIFILIGIILCSLTSLSTGTSWGTAGTIGIALMGMGVGLGIPAPIIAGMVVSGAFFGDKMSPISDTTNLAAVSAGANLYNHIRAMTYTTIPSYILALIIYTFIGFKYAKGTGSTEDIELIQGTISGSFNINPIVILPMIVLFTLNLLRFPAV